VVLVPVSAKGTRAKLPFPDVSVDTSLAAFAGARWRQAISLLASLGDARFRRELLAALRISRGRPGPIIRLALHQAQARLAELWANRLKTTLAYDGAVDAPVFYTWWFDGVTLGLARYARRANAPVVSRAHGFDLYESRYDPPYIPFRAEALSQLSRVFPDSAAGTRYLGERYPDHRGAIVTCRLGTEDPQFLNRASSDGTFRLLSCSFIRPVKRVELILDGVLELARRWPERRFVWTHIGGGSRRAGLEAGAARLAPPNVQIRFVDYPGNEHLREFYRREPLDLFLNVSQSEGTPVSIMEAISVGIPVLATAVGGNVEIVGPANGMLLSPDPDAIEVADAIATLMNDPQRLADLRRGSRSRWEQEYSAQHNYHRFAELLHAL
jgi:glycosyltransferase involved in cell wall biosynthesis